MPPRRAVERARSSRSGGLPRDNAVPPPTGATARFRSAASASRSATACGESGATTVVGWTPSMSGAATAAPSGSWPQAGADRDSGSERIDAQLLGLLQHRLVAQGTDLAADVALREHLVGVEEARGVEGVLDAGEGRQVLAGEDEGHKVALLGADAVLAGEGAAGVDAGFEQVVAGVEDALDVARLAAIEEHERMEIAVAGVEDV